MSFAFESQLNPRNENKIANMLRVLRTPLWIRNLNADKETNKNWKLLINDCQGDYWKYLADEKWET